MAAEFCNDCKYYQANEGMPHGYCFCKPPVIILMPQPAPSVKSRLAPMQQGMEAVLVPASVRPMVRQTDTCAEWKRK